MTLVRPSGPGKPPAWRRWLGIVLRTAHLMAVVGLGAALAGAPGFGWGGPGTLVTGVALLLVEWGDGRLQLRQAAGWVVLFKLAAVALLLAWPPAAPAGFWALMALSALSAHAPRQWRHWPAERAGRAR